jgi:hypothetical protein
MRVLLIQKPSEDFNPEGMSQEEILSKVHSAAIVLIPVELSDEEMNNIGTSVLDALNGKSFDPNEVIAAYMSLVGE